MNSFVETLVYFFIAFVLLGVGLTIIKWSNETQMENCANEGGVFVYNPDEGHSLCQLSK